MDFFNNFFFLPGDPEPNLFGYYSLQLVALSYFVASFAGYVALDIANNLRKSEITSFSSNKWWLLAGAFTLGGGIWTMHFVGMEAFIMPMPMILEPMLTLLSMVFAITASFFAFLLILRKKTSLMALFWGGVVIGIGIASMHYTGMAAMLDVKILYSPVPFILSILVAIVTSQAALFFMLQNPVINTRMRILRNVGSALIMGGAICGMHYLGMYAANFYQSGTMIMEKGGVIQSEILTLFIALMTLLIMGVGLILSTYKQYIITLEGEKNKELLVKEKELRSAEQKMVALNKRLIETAREAGMSEITSSVLHNVGNVLNSVNISTCLLQEHLSHSELFALHEIAKHIQKEPSKSATDVELPKFICALSQVWTEEYNKLTAELIALRAKVDHIKEIINAQQGIGGANYPQTSEEINIESLVRDALIINNLSLDSGQLQVELNLQKSPVVSAYKIKLLQILINLIRNAKDSVILSKKTGQKNHYRNLS